MNKQEWTTALVTFSRSQFASNPIPDLDKLTDEEKWQYRIIGGGIVGFLEHGLPHIFQERQVVLMKNCDPDPFVVLTSTIPGLVAIEEVISDSSKSIVALLQADYEKWEQQNPVDEFNFHVHHWSYFRELDKELLARAIEAYPSTNPDHFRIHTEGYMWGLN
ncbi:MAG: hypothetical protein C4575_14145 [Desulforudis sp.]|jgi:hypothetical protein|nr:MAG: hypothetical protein C4575_14145 [Desulforudis sp.]